MAGARESLTPHAPRHEQGNSTGPAKPKAAPKKADKAPKAVLQLQDGRFVDHRWENGRWTLSKFANPTTSEMDWPAWNSVRLLRERICVSALCAATCMDAPGVYTSTIRSCVNIGAKPGPFDCD